MLLLLLLLPFFFSETVLQNLILRRTRSARRIKNIEKEAYSSPRDARSIFIFVFFFSIVQIPSTSFVPLKIFDSIFFPSLFLPLFLGFICVYQTTLCILFNVHQSMSTRKSDYTVGYKTDREKKTWAIRMCVCLLPLLLSRHIVPERAARTTSASNGNAKGEEKKNSKSEKKTLL